MNIPSSIVEAAKRLGAEHRPYIFGRLDDRTVKIDGSDYQHPGWMSGFFIELIFPDQYFATPQNTVYLRYIEQKFIFEDIGYCVFAIDEAAQTAFCLRFDDPKPDGPMVYRRIQNEVPVFLDIDLPRWLDALVPVERPKDSLGEWQKRLVNYLRKADESSAKDLIREIGVNARHPLSGTTPAHHCALSGARDLFEWAISKGANLGAKTTDGATPFAHAAWGGQIVIMQLIVAHDGMPEIDQLQKALEQNLLLADKVFAYNEERATEAVKLLLEWGANPNFDCLIFPDRGTLMAAALNKALRYSKMIPRIELLLKEGGDPDVRDERDRLLAEVAVGQNCSDLANLLVQFGASIEIDETQTKQEESSQTKIENEHAGRIKGTITKGAFKGMTAYAEPADGSGQIDVLIDMFGKNVHQKIPESDFQPQ